MSVAGPCQSRIPNFRDRPAGDVGVEDRQGADYGGADDDSQKEITIRRGLADNAQHKEADGYPSHHGCQNIGSDRQCRPFGRLDGPGSTEEDFVCADPILYGYGLED